MFLSLKNICSLCLVGSLFCQGGYAASEPGVNKPREAPSSKVSKPQVDLGKTDIKRNAEGELVSARVTNPFFQINQTRNSQGGWDLDALVNKTDKAPESRVIGALTKNQDGSFRFVGKSGDQAIDMAISVPTDGGSFSIRDNGTGATFSLTPAQLKDFAQNGVGEDAVSGAPVDSVMSVRPRIAVTGLVIAFSIGFLLGEILPG